MNFWMEMLAVFCGIWLFLFTHTVARTVYEKIRDVREDRKIGFGNDDEGKKKKPKGAQMRKIGFGENEDI